MPGQRLPMRQVREVLRLKHVCGHSGHQIAAMVGVSRYTVAEYLRRAAVVGITWPVPAALDDVALERKLFTPPFTPAEALRPQPEWARIHAELRKPGVTLLLLWEEYRAGQLDGYGYSRFCDLARDGRGRLSPTMRQTHPAGERLFVDYAGQTAEVIDGATGEIRRAQIFVAVLGGAGQGSDRVAGGKPAEGPPTTPTRRLAGHSRYRIGSAAMSARSPAWAAWPGRSCATTSRPASPRPAATSPASAGPTRTWRPITARRSYRPGCASRATRPRSRSPCRLSNAGSWPGCAIAGSTPWRS